jgi:hypothetical protein
MGELKYSKGEPTHDPFEETAYAFMGWIDITDNKKFYPRGTSLPMVTQNSIFRAHYNEGPRKCTIIFKYINTGLPSDTNDPISYENKK